MNKTIKINNSVIRRHGIFRPVIGYIFNDIYNKYQDHYADSIIQNSIEYCTQLINTYNFIKHGGKIEDSNEYLSMFNLLSTAKETVDKLFYNYILLCNCDKLDIVFDPSLVDINSEEFDIYTDYILPSKYLKEDD